MRSVLTPRAARPAAVPPLPAAALALALLAGGLLGCDAAASTLPPAGPNAVTVVISTAPAGENVLVDGALAGASPATVKLNPGPHRIKAAGSGYLPMQDQKIQVGAGEPTTYTLTLIASH